MKNQSKFIKLQKRLQRSIEKGTFFLFAQRKQVQLARRIQRYARSLKQAVKPAILSAFFALGLGTAAQAQITFSEQTGVNNPLSSVNLQVNVAPTFTDIDNDGDYDAFMGADGYIDSIVYYKNLGTNAVPNFVMQTGADNPLSGISHNFPLPTFVDIDNDGDQDLFAGNYYGEIFYYENTGTASAPAFTAQTGANNPFNGVNFVNVPVMSFVDIDNDGDQDAFIGEDIGGIHYYENTGTASAPAFTAQTGANNPFNGISVGSTHSAPSLVDIDNDGDYDAFIGEQQGYITYYENTGTASAPVFTAQTGTNNPFNGVDVGTRAKPTFVDIDNDGDYDAFIGNETGDVAFFENTTPVGVFYVEGNETNLKVYPNPTKEQLFFDRTITGMANVYNLSGQLLLQEQLNSETELSINYLSKGIYILKIQEEEGVGVVKFTVK